MNCQKHRLGKLPAIPWILLALLGLYACGGSSGSGNSPPPPASPPPPPPPTVQVIGFPLVAEDVVAGSDATGSGTADVNFNVTDGEISITVGLTGVDATAVTLRSGHAGVVGTELYELDTSSNTDVWSLGTTALTSAEIDALEAGALYLVVTTDTEPDGSLRGQIVPDGVRVIRFDLAANQITTNSTSTSTGRGWITFDTVNFATINIVTYGLTDAVSVEFFDGFAGQVGQLMFGLTQDTVNTSLWQRPTDEVSSRFRNGIATGEIYAVVSTTSLPQGEIRGQVIPDGIELVITDLTNTAVIMNGTLSKSQTTMGRAMTTVRSDDMTSNVNLFQIPDADNIELRRAPEGQNGPVFASYTQDIDDPNLWSLRGVVIDGALTAGLDNRTLYINVATPATPGGVARGQLETEESQQPPDTSAFVVVSIDPPNAAEVTALPASIVATLSRNPLSESVSPSAVLTEASGGDGSFGDGNEVTIVPTSVIANGATVEISLAGVVAANDVYRVSLIGGGSTGIVDQSAIPLDGNGDGQPGGIYESAFELLGPEPASFSTIQETILTPTCATSNCHSGANPPDGLNLTAALAYENIVNVASVQMPGLFRINPGNPGASYLVRKIEGVGIVANRMPLGRAPLTAEEIDLIRRWVSEGAQNN